MRDANAGVIPPRRSPPCKHMYRYVGHVVSGIEKSDLDQVLSRERPSSRLRPPFGVLFARHASPCSPLPTLPRAASAVLASSPCEGCCIRVFGQNSCSHLVCLFVRIDTYQSDMYQVRNGWLNSCFYSQRVRGRRFDPRSAPRSLFCVPFFFISFFCHHRHRRV